MAKSEIIFKSADGRTIKYRKKPTGFFTKDNKVIPLGGREKKLIFPKDTASMVINSPSFSKMALSKNGNEFARKVILDSIERLNDNREDLIKKDQSKYLTNHKNLENALDALSANYHLRFGETTVTTSQPTKEEKKEIQKIQGNQNQFADFIFKSLNIDKEGMISNDEKAKIERTAVFVNHVITTGREPVITEERKKQLENSRELIALQEQGLFEDYDIQQIGIMKNDDRKHLEEVMRNPRASLTPNEIELAKERNKLMATMSEPEKQKYLETLQLSSPVISGVVEKIPQVTERQLKEKIQALQTRNKDIHDGKFAIDPKAEKQQRLEGVNLQIKHQQDNMSQIKNMDKILPAQKQTRIEEISANMKALFQKKHFLEGAPDEYFASQDKKKLLDKNKEMIAKAEDRLSWAKKLANTIPNKSNYKSEVLNNIALSQTSKNKLELIAEIVTKRKLGEGTDHLQKDLERIKKRDAIPAGITGVSTQETQNKGIFQFQPCSKCIGTGFTGDSRVCRKCEGTGSARFADLKKASGQTTNPNFMCKDCNKRGFSSPECKKCQGRTNIQGQSTLQFKSGREFESKTNQTQFGAMRSHATDTEESRMKIQPPASNLMPITRIVNGFPRRFWVDKDTRTTPIGVDPLTGLKRE